MNVQELQLDEVLPLRSLVLRNNRGLEFARFEEDNLVGAFHLGVVVDATVVSISSFMPCAHKDLSGRGWQLRGMATHPMHLGMGYGSKLLDKARTKLMEKSDYIWCNARFSAVPFYQKNNFQIISDEFIIENIGPHFQMVLNFK